MNSFLAGLHGMVVADEQNETLYLDITQTFHLWFSIFSPKPANLVTKLKLQSYGAPWDPSVVGVYFTLLFHGKGNVCSY